MFVIIFSLGVLSASLNNAWVSHAVATFVGAIYIWGWLGRQASSSFISVSAPSNVPSNMLRAIFWGSTTCAALIVAPGIVYFASGFGWRFVSTGSAIPQWLYSKFHGSGFYQYPSLSEWLAEYHLVSAVHALALSTILLGIIAGIFWPKRLGIRYWLIFQLYREFNPRPTIVEQHVRGGRLLTGTVRSQIPSRSRPPWE